MRSEIPVVAAGTLDFVITAEAFMAWAGLRCHANDVFLESDARVQRGIWSQEFLGLCSVWML